jgi:FecR protein
MTTNSHPMLHRAIPRAIMRIGGRMPRLAAILLWAATALFALPGTAFAEDDLPGRVGRVAEIGGELFLAPQDKPEEWIAIGLNYPVTTGDNLWVGTEGRAEVDFGAGQFRLAGDTNLHVSRLDDRQFALFVAQGRVNVRVRVLEPGETARIDTPNAQVVLTRPGLYRVDVSEDREHTQLAVREGEANVLTFGAVQQVLPGQSAAVDGADPQYATVRNGVGNDGFDAWIASRERRYEGGAGANYVSPQMVGAADLDRYGTWNQVPEYGAVWYPSDVGADWAPYRNGYWTEVGGWGPTWVDAAPWGYAPFHYGRWAYIGNRWGWCPGAYVRRPMWAPALVGWAGGPGWGLSASVGAPVYGWVPLAWGEPYRPWWGRCSNGCWDRYNRPYAVNVAVRQNSPPTRYVNWNAPGGISAVSGSSLVMRRPVQANLVRVPGGVGATAPLLASAPISRGDAGQISVRRPGQGVPPPASTFYPTIARPGGVPGGIGAVPGGPATGAASPVVRTRPGPSPSATAPPTQYGRPTQQASPAPAAAPTYGGGVGAAAGVAPAARPAPAPAPAQVSPNQAGIAGTPGAAPPARGDQNGSQQRTFNRTMPPAPVTAPAAPPVQSLGAPVQSLAAPPAQSYAAPQNNAVTRQVRPQPIPIQQPQAQSYAAPPASLGRAAPVPQVAAPVHVAPPVGAAPARPAPPPGAAPAQEGGNVVRAPRGEPRGDNQPQK